VKSRVRWFVLHGLIRVAARRWAAKGDPQARLIMDESIRPDPFPLYEQIRARGAVSPTRIGHITASHEIVSAVLRSDDFRTTSSSTAVPPALRWVERATRRVPLFHPVEPPSLLAVDPPEHTRYRTLVSSVFTARAVAAMRPDVQAIADRLLDGLGADAAAGRPVDIVQRYCARLPVAVISDILGVDESERDIVLEYGEQAAPSLDFGLRYAQYRRVDEGLAGFNTWLGDHLARLRRNPGDDLLSKLIQARTSEGDQLSEHELRATAGLLLAAGFETTVNLLGSGIRLLTEHPDQLAVLRADPSLWANAVDEVLRVESPVQLTARVASATTTLGGREIREGTLVALLLAAANRDPEVFVDPARFDVARANANRHLSFSGGRHFCLGAALARLEGEIGLRSLFDRFPELASSGPGERRPTRVLRGWAMLPVSLSSAADRQPAA
jgi:cytochrome P450